MKNIFKVLLIILFFNCITIIRANDSTNDTVAVKTSKSEETKLAYQMINFLGYASWSPVPYIAALV